MENGAEDDKVDPASKQQIPEKSSVRYKKCLKEFNNWMDSNQEADVTEKVLMAYLQHKSATLAPNSLASLYSMLKTCLPKLGSFVQVQAYLKKITKNYKPSKSLSFASEEFHEFVLRAPDDRFLMHKVVLILGISGTLRGNEICDLKSSDVVDKGEFIQVEVKDAKANVDRRFIVVNSDGLNFANVIRKYSGLRPKDRPDPRYLFAYGNGKGSIYPVGVHRVRTVPSEAAKYLNLPDPKKYTGHALRRTEGA